MEIPGRLLHPFRSTLNHATQGIQLCTIHIQRTNLLSPIGHNKTKISKEGGWEFFARQRFPPFLKKLNELYYTNKKKNSVPCGQARGKLQQNPLNDKALFQINYPTIKHKKALLVKTVTFREMSGGKNKKGQWE